MKFFTKLLKFITIITLTLFFIYLGLYCYAKTTDTLDINNYSNYYFYDIEENLYTNSGSNEWVSIGNISKHLINATISIEDKNFYDHQGFDFLRIIKAFYINIKNRKTLQGASTISQQYAKNLYLDFDKKWERKIDEAWLTIRLESQYDKDEIIEGYLNTINYGGVFGIENASKYYFNKKAIDLSLAEATILAGIPKSPSNYSPINNEEAAKKRQKIIIDSMVRNNYITEDEALNAYSTSLNYIGSYNDNKSKTIMYYQDAVIEELKNISSIPDSLLNKGGLKIYTNLDMKAQSILEQSINKNVTNKDIQVASIAIDPKTGKILALIGGKDYSKSQYNRATQAKRQVGSTIKPFLYYAALENGFTPSTTFTSEKTTFTFSEDKTYSPKNYNDSYPNKKISLATAIAYSDNIYAVKTHVFLGEESLVETAKRLGINTKLNPIPSLALGSEEIRLIEMIRAFSTLANGGIKTTPYFISRVEDMDGHILYEPKEEKELVLNKSLTFILNELLANTSSADLIDYSYPTCYTISHKMTRKYAIKTGTTNTDHLIFGYNNDLLIGIWSGYDDNKETNYQDGLAIKNTWVDSMEEYLIDGGDLWYEMPSNVVGVLVDPISGDLVKSKKGKKKMLYYIKGTEPTEKNLPLDSVIPTIKPQ